VTNIRDQLEQAASDEGVPLRTDVPVLLRRARSGRRRHRTRTTAVAALSAAAIVALGSVLGSTVLPTDSDTRDNSDALASATGPGPSSDPGLPPTADNLYQVVVTANGWTFDGMDNSQRDGGSQYWTSGGQWLDVQWYDASLYDSYVADRRDGTVEREVELLGQSGLEFTEKLEDLPEGDNNEVPLTYDGDYPAGDTAGGGGHRVYTILPAVGDFFLMIDAYTADKAAFDEVIGSLTRVDETAWQQVIDEATVTPAEGEAFLAEAKQDVPMPDGVEVTVDDLDLPQSPYQVRAAFSAPVLCGWAEQYVAGDEQALETLRDSSEWPVLKAMLDEGDYAEVVAMSIEQLADGTTDKGGPYTLELFGQAVGC
jgi:hypothetical protein